MPTTLIPTAYLQDGAVTAAKMASNYAKELAEVGSFGANDFVKWDGSNFVGATLTGSYLTIPLTLLSAGTSGDLWTDQPSGLTEWNSGTYTRLKMDLTYATQFRITGTVKTAGVSGAKVRIRYSTDSGSSFNNLEDTTTTGDVAIDATGNFTGTFVNVVSGAKSDVLIALFGISGDGAADPVLSNVVVEVKITTSLPVSVVSAGGTDLTVNTIADGEVLHRTGTNIDGAVPANFISISSGNLIASLVLGLQYFGSGEDGAVTFDGSAVSGWTLASTTYTYTGTAKVFQYTNCTIAANYTIKPAGNVILVKDTLTFGTSSSISGSGNAASNETAGGIIANVTNSYLGAGSAGAAGASADTGGGNNGTSSSAVTATSLGGQGGRGGDSNASTNRTGAVGGTITAWTSAAGPFWKLVTEYMFKSGTSFSQVKGGSGGGSGGASWGGGAASGTSYSGAGGGGGNPIVVAARLIVGATSAQIQSNGGLGGHGRTTNSLYGITGGGGGGGAGGVTVLADNITGPLTVAANGANGGNAFLGSALSDDPNGGNGGNGGYATVYCRSSSSLTVTASAGTGGSGAGTGSSGSSGAAGTAGTYTL